MSIRQDKLPVAALERIDRICAEFEDAWRNGNPLGIESILPDSLSPLERKSLLAELLLLEVDYRRRRGERPTAAEYSDRFPDDAETIYQALAEGQDATLATNLVAATPIEIVSCVRSRTRRLTSRAISTPDPNSRREPVTSRKASSSESGSMVGVKASKIERMTREISA